jgi:peptidoglycan hydrolase CwlO-like protein
MEDELNAIESQINGIEDCDELQMMNFSILGLRSDMDNYRQESEMTEEEIEQIDDKIDQLEAAWNGKWALLDCEQDITDDELDTSGEEEGGAEYDM